MDYKELILQWKNIHQSKISVQYYYGHLIDLFNELKLNGFTKKDLNEENAKLIIDIFSIPKLSEYYQNKLTKYLIYYIDNISKVMLNNTQSKLPKPRLKTETIKSINNDCELVDPIDVKIGTKNREFDYELLKELGVNPII